MKLENVSTRWNLMRVSTSLFVILIMVGCFGSNEGNNGVASIEQASKLSEGNLNSDNQSIPMQEPSRVSRNSNEAAPLNDEEIATLFTSCLRDSGFDVSDPVMNADGTVDMLSLRTNIAEALSKDPMLTAKGREVLSECLPLLQGATFAQAPSQENLIEIQDNLLDFAECLRDAGVDVPDPDFSKGTRPAMVSLFQGIDISNPKIQQNINQCSQANFSGRIGGRR